MNEKHRKRYREVFDHGYKSIGKVIYHFQQLEEELCRAVSFLIDPTEGDSADIVVCELSFKQLTNIGYSVFSLFNIEDKDDHLREWQRVLGLCLKAENRRNQLVHSNFYATYRGGADNLEFVRNKSTAKFKRGRKSVDEDMTDATVQSYLEDIAGVIDQISHCLNTAFPGWEVRQWEPKST